MLSQNFILWAKLPSCALKVDFSKAEDSLACTVTLDQLSISQVLAPPKAVRLEKTKKGPSPNLAYMARPDWLRRAQS